MSFSCVLNWLVDPDLAGKGRWLRSTSYEALRVKPISNIEYCLTLLQDAFCLTVVQHGRRGPSRSGDALRCTSEKFPEKRRGCPECTRNGPGTPADTSGCETGHRLTSGRQCKRFRLTHRAHPDQKVDMAMSQCSGFGGKEIRNCGRVYPWNPSLRKRRNEGTAVALILFCPGALVENPRCEVIQRRFELVVTEVFLTISMSSSEA